MPYVTKENRSLVFSFYLPALTFAFSQGLLLPILPLFAASLSDSYGLIGVVLASDGLGLLFGDLSAGLFLKRIGQKRSMILGIGGAMFATIALFWMHGILAVVLWRLLAGFSTGIFNVSRHAYVSDAVVHVQRGRAIALFGGIHRFGRFAGPAVGGLIAGAYGLRVPFLLFGVGCSIALIAVASSFSESLSARGKDRSTIIKKGEGFPTDEPASYRTWMFAGFGFFLAEMIRAAPRIIVPLYAADVVGLDVEEIGWIVTMSSAVSMTLFHPAGLIMDRWGRKFTIVPSFLLQGVGIGVLPLAGSFVGLIAVSSLIGFGHGLGAGSMMTLGADLAPAKSRDFFFAIWWLVGDAGLAGGPLIVGGVAALFVLSTASWIMSGVGISSAMVFLHLVPETLNRH